MNGSIAKSLLLGFALLLGSVSTPAQTMNRAQGLMTMQPAGPGGMYDGLRRDTLGGPPGMRLFREGILPGYRSAVATRAGNSVSSDQLACANCHGRSGLGAREGEQQVPAVVADVLFAPREGATPRPAYTDASLARAIGQGVDPTGRELSAVMPRYTLAPDEFASLAEYLHLLQPVPSPGVADGVLHLATVVSDAADPVQRAAMLAVMNAYLRDVNAAAAGGSLRWELHVWEVHGKPDSWRAQLEAYASAQPVAALVGGLAPEEFLPMHRFCEEHRTPCIFPDTALPAVQTVGFFTFYFDRGLDQEGRVLAHYLMDHPADFAQGPVVELMSSGWAGFVASSALRRELGRAAARRVVDRAMDPAAGKDAAFWRELIAQMHPSALILWLEDPDLEAIMAGLDAGPGAGPGPQVFLSGKLLSTNSVPPAANPAGKRVHVVSLNRFGADPAAYHGWLDWLARHGLSVEAPGVQADAYFALEVLRDALAHLDAHGVIPERLVERIEYSAGASVQHALRSALGLGMGQRFASKGGYLLPLDALNASASGAVDPATAELIVP